MQLIKLTEDELKAVTTPINIQKSQSYIGNFYNCSMDNNKLIGKIRGNHGEYNVEVNFDSDGKILNNECKCETSKNEFCKHSIALCLTYIYTPWIFSGKKMDRNNIESLEDAKYFVSTTTLREIFIELKEKGYSLADISDLLKISTIQLSSVIKDDQVGKSHLLTEAVKLACLFLLEKNIAK